jgi:hypothetical protein
MEHFIEALERFVVAEIRASGEPADYNHDAVEILDARNHLFRKRENCATDEEHNIYALREFFCIDDDTLDFIPDRGRMRSVARNWY